MVVITCPGKPGFIMLAHTIQKHIEAQYYASAFYREDQANRFTLTPEMLSENRNSSQVEAFRKISTGI
jgi:hypothetical protein